MSASPPTPPSADALAPERIAEFSETIARIQRFADHRDYNDESSDVIAGHVEALLEAATALLADRERFERRVGELEGELSEAKRRLLAMGDLVARATPEPSNG